MTKLQDLKNRCREAFKDDLVEGGIDLRFSTGSYDVDRALGGGLVRGRFHLWQGKESTCKSSLSIHAMKQINLINWKTGEYDPSLSNPSPCMYVDVEGTFDYAWAEKIGVPKVSFDDYNYLVKPTTGEMAADIILNGIESEALGLIIVDSNEAFVSAKTQEKSLDQDVMCDRAKILSRMYRVGQAHLLSALNKEKPWQTPTVICLNQLRDTVGSRFGGTHVPGGRAQNHYSSTILQFNSPLVKDGEKTEGLGEFKGVTKKNKTAPPKKAFLYTMALKNVSDFGKSGLPAGQIDNASSILKDIRTLELAVKEKDGYIVFGEKFRVLKDFRDKVHDDEQFQKWVWQHLLELDRE